MGFPSLSLRFGSRASPPRLDVPTSIPLGSVRVCERHGIPRSALLGRPSITEAELSANRRIPWEAFVEFNARLEATWKGRGGLQRFAQLIVPEMPELRVVARAMLTPRQLLELMVGVGNWAHPLIETRSRRLPDEQLEVRMRIPGAYRDDPNFFVVCAHSMAQAPTLAGLPAAFVEFTLREREAVLLFTPPPGRTVFTRAADAASELTRLTLERIVQLQEEVGELHHAARRNAVDVEARAKKLGRKWALTPRQTEVLEGLANGHSNREIADALGCTERTVELHVSAILRQSGFPNRTRIAAEFWSRTT